MKLYYAFHIENRNGAMLTEDTQFYALFASRTLMCSFELCVGVLRDGMEWIGLDVCTYVCVCVVWSEGSYPLGI